ncbi:MAG TPA: hypothetical protein VLV86_21385 [Vicinamibacterales bacterium]|nr:hypothetical protein [Vicinamibacterales bacterium]
MITLTQLLLPALASAVLVFVVSSIVHMLTPWHAGDFQRLPNEDAVLAALRQFNLVPGAYVAPRPGGMKDMGTPEFQEKMRLGPNVMMNVMPNARGGMGQQLALWFLYAAAIALFSGYVTSRAVGAGVDRSVVFKFVAAVAFAAYSVGLWQMSIWYRRSWIVTLKSTIDGVLYGCLTAAAFAWFWPR